MEYFNNKTNHFCTCMFMYIVMVSESARLLLLLRLTSSRNVQWNFETAAEQFTKFRETCFYTKVTGGIPDQKIT